ncbi:MAG: tRNA (guanosine(37)-N1)-methyltransferase TrmD, partial [Methyloprofundus sp.]|nr:tRNA (guanosine(37)-N1)-methyltransferase TrmD [Methyloprofundus sp.]
SVWNPRDYTLDKHKTVDDRPYGGGTGMVMKYQPLKDAVDDAKQSFRAERVKVVYLSPQGKPITQKLLNENVALDQLILVAGRYEGIDERFIQNKCQEEWSLGDFVISGGELAALVVIDAISRLIPGVLGAEESAMQDSHMQGLLDCPHYTRPEELEANIVPSVLLSGNHKEIERWRMKQALGQTWQKRPDLLIKKELTAQQQALLEEFKIELKYK